MPKSLRPQRLTLLRRIPMPLLATIIGLVVGFVVWVALDQVQPKAFRDIFSQELKTRLDQQARETLIRFENFVQTHTSTTRLLTNHRQLAVYLEPVYWSDIGELLPIVYLQTPPWLPDDALWKSLVRPSHVLLVDLKGQPREIYQVGEQPLPKQLRGSNDFFLNERRVQSLMTTLDGRPYLLVSETAEDATGTVMGSLMLVVPIDGAFLTASQQGITGSDVVLGLIDADEQRFLTTSDPRRIPVDSPMEQATKNFLVTAQSFFTYEGATLNMQFATLVPLGAVEAIRERVAGVERRQRLVAAIAFISIFTLVFFLLSERLNAILRRISRFSRRALGTEQPLLEQGNQLFVLEDWIKQFIRTVRDARDEMRQQHESEMQESEALKRTIMETALDSIITIDESGRIIEFNNTAQETFGYHRNHVIGHDFSSLLLHPESRKGFAQLLDLLQSGIRSEDEDIRSEMTALRAGDNPIPVELAIKPIQLHDRTVLTVYMHDISNRRRAEREIRSLAKFAAESPSPVLRVNRPGVIIYANAASTALLEYWGCGRGQTLPLYWRNRIADIFEFGQDWETEVVCAGHIYSLLLTPIVDLGYVNIYGRDVTAVRRAESQAREHQQELVHVCRLSTMGEMATGLAHELNQPLSAIANYANGCSRRLQASDASGGDEIIFALGQISSQADRAGEIIKRLRSLVGKQQPVRTVADLNDLVREVCSFVEFEARKTNVEIEQELSLTPLPVRVDVVQIEQVLLNLVRNALDALLEVPEERRSLVVRTGCSGVDSAVVQVIDSGPGISESAMRRLFEPFFTTKRSGMGMGLVISQTIVEDHNGKIEAERLEAGGSRFSMSLPYYGGD